MGTGSTVRRRRGATSETRLFPASLQQLWDYDATPEHTAPSNLTVSWRLAGAASRETWAWVLDRLIERHAAMRTCLCERDGEAVQAVQASSSIIVRHLNLTRASVRERERAIVAATSRLGRKPVRLTQLPPFEALLFSISPTEHVLSLSAPHTFWDGWSVNVITSELLAHHAARSGGAPPPEPLAGGDAEVVAARREQRAGAEFMRWRGDVQELPRWLAFPQARTTTTRSRSVHVSLGVRETPGWVCPLLDAIAETQHASPAAPAVAAAAIAVAMTTDTWAFLLGYNRACRDEPAARRVIGMLAENLPLAVRLEKDSRFTDAVSAVDRSMREHRSAGVCFAALYPPGCGYGPEMGEATSDVTINYIPRWWRHSREEPTDAFVSGIEHWQHRFPTRSLWDYRTVDLSVYRTSRGGMALRVGYNSEVISRAVAELVTARLDALLRIASLNPERTLAALISSVNRLLALHGTGPLGSASPREDRILWRRRRGPQDAADADG
jgi:hypothetical protein